MTNKAKMLLEKMASEYDISKQTSFDSIFYLGYSEDVLIELECNGYIVRKTDIIGSIELTTSGYSEAKK